MADKDAILAKKTCLLPFIKPQASISIILKLRPVQ
jgi:hypothetical protein